MKKSLYSLLILALVVSCEKYPEPGVETLEKFYCSIIGNNQTAEGNTYLSKEIGAQIQLDYVITDEVKTFRMEIEVTAGAGSIDEDIIYADETGLMTTNWKLGENGNEQELTCRIKDEDNKLYVEFTINATAFYYNKWNTIEQGYLCGIQDMVADTINHRSMMISGSNLYTKTDKFYNWQSLITYLPTNMRELEINSKGEVFAASWNGNLYKTSDWGQTWNTLGSPIPGNMYHYQLTITKDDYIWANKWEYGIYCSKDDGLTWTKDTTGLEYQEELGRIFCFADTSHMAVSCYNLTILKTTDDGISWTPIPTPQYSLSMFVTDNNTLIAQNQGGFRLHKSVDGGQTYREVFSPGVAYGTQSRHCFLKYGNDYYVLAPGGGIWKTKEFEDFERLISFSVQRYLFIDHSGNIYAAGFNYDPTLIFSSGE